MLQIRVGARRTTHPAQCVDEFDRSPSNGFHNAFLEHRLAIEEGGFIPWNEPDHAHLMLDHRWHELVAID